LSTAARQRAGTEKITSGVLDLYIRTHTKRGAQIATQATNNKKRFDMVLYSRFGGLND